MNIINNMVTRKAAVLLTLLSMAMLVGCEIDTKVRVTKDNPPKLTFSGNGILAQMYVSGPYSLDEVKLVVGVADKIVTNEELLKIKQVIGENRTIWQLDPGRGKRIPDLPTIIYGEIPHGFRQVYPRDNVKPPQLLDGKYYSISAPSYNANSHMTYFIVKSGNVVEVSTDEILKSGSVGQ
ncbi:MAG: hypothetical protein IPJ07_19545 [Acidobacteria bacterium]|nr:hypothetical protein [Acidobacteriota bacterium]